MNAYIFNKGLQAYNSIFKKQGENPKSLFSKGNVDLHAAMKNSYARPKDQKTFGIEQGYSYDPELSNDNQQVYWNPESKKLLFSVTGTHNLSDIGTDIKLMTSGVESTQRYREANRTLAKAKAKYSPEETTAYGTSLGGSIVSKLKDVDRKVTLNKAHLPFEKTGKREQAIRSSGDIVSVFATGGKHVHTIAKGDLTNPATWLNAHNSDSIKGKGYFIG